MKILMCVDGSQSCGEGLQAVAPLFDASRDEITLFYAPPMMRYGEGELGTNLVERSQQALAEAVFDEARKYLPAEWKSGLKTMVGQGTPRRAIPRAADVINAELIVMGARGHGMLTSLLLGSVSKSIVHESKRPVLIGRPSSVAGDGPFNVLVAWDASTSSIEALKLVQKMQLPEGSVGRAIHVIEPMFPGELPEWLETKARSSLTQEMASHWVAQHEAEKKHRIEELAALLAKLPAAFQHHEPLLVEGCPSEQVLAAIEREKVQLVVVGARGLGALDRVFIGSTSDRVLNQSPCSVLIVPHND